MGQPRRPRVLVVTPAFNAERYIDEAIMSVISQACVGTRLFYHVQDGGSRDGTLDRLSAWAERIDRGHIPHFAGELHFSFASQSDGGMYQAVNRAFRRLRPRAEDILTWINSDDRLAPGAVAAVVQVFGHVPECRFLSGRVSLLNGEGAMMTLDPPRPWARETIAAGLHDGRSMPFLMQEGTFFSGQLWKTVGGADESFRLAGDWDLWRRMAAAADHFTVDAITGYHRRRPGQLSEDMAAYYREVDRRKATLAPSPRETPAMLNLVRFDTRQGQWLHFAFEANDAVSSTVIIDGVEVRACACKAGSGFGPVEGPYPEHNLPHGMRWAVAETATITVTAPADGRFRARFTLRTTQPGSWLAIAVNDRVPHPFLLSDPRPSVSQVVEFPAWLVEGVNTFTLDIQSYNGTEPRLLLIACEVVAQEMAPLPSLSEAAEGAPMAVIVSATTDPDRLERSLVSALSVAAGRVRVIVSTDDNPLCRLLIERLAHAVTVISAEDSEADEVDQAIVSDARAEGALYLIRLAAGTVLIPAAVRTAVRIAEAMNADEVAGPVALRGPRGDLLRLGLPGADGAGVLRRLTPVHDERPRRVDVARAMVAQTAAERTFESGPIVWLLEDGAERASSSMFLLAAALTLMGVDARHTRMTASRIAAPFDAMGGEILCAEAIHRAGLGNVVFRETSDTLVLDGGSPETLVSLPRAVDTVRLVSRDRAEARARLGLPRDALLAVIAEEAAESTGRLLGRIARSSGGLIIQVINLGVPIARWRGRMSLSQPGWNIDPVLLSYYVSACDLALVSGGHSSRLALTAWACGVQVTDGVLALYPDGSTRPIAADLTATLRAVGLRERGPREGLSRELVEARHSIEALALAVRAARPGLSRLPRLAAWLERCEALQSGDVRVQSIPARGLSPEPFRGQCDGVLVPLTGCRSDGGAGGALTIRSATASALMVLGQVSGTTLHLTFRGVAGQAWTFALDGGAPSEAREAGSESLYLKLDAPTGPGVHRLDVALQSREGPGDILLHLEDWRVTGAASPERARLDHASVLPLSTGRELLTLAHDGDWLRRSGFGELEPPFPAAGFHAPLGWSIARRCSVVVRVCRGGARWLRLVLSGIVQGQCIRPIVAGVPYDWSAPLDGAPGRIAYRSWLLEMAQGDVEIVLELSSSQRVADGRDLGIILLGLELARPDASDDVG